MAWLVVALLQFVVIARGIRSEERAGVWSWSKFFFSLAFAALEWVLLWLPMRYIDLHSRWFAPAVTASAIVALLNFVWFIVVCRRWKLPDGRTSLQAWRDEHSDPN